jgi:hypothetical protein
MRSNLRTIMHRNDSTMDTSDALVNDSDADKKLPIHRSRRKPNLDLRVLGVCIGSGLDELDLAFVRYVQDTPHTPLYMEVLQVRVPAHLVIVCCLPELNSTGGFQFTRRSKARSSTCCAKARSDRTMAQPSMCCSERCLRSASRSSATYTRS